MKDEGKKCQLAGQKLILELDQRLNFLSSREIALIDELLSSIGAFGEIRLRVEKGRLRFVASTKSCDAF